MITFVLLFIIFYGASITNRISYKIIILGKNPIYGSDNVTRMLPGNTNQNMWFFKKTFVYLSPALRNGEYAYGLY